MYSTLGNTDICMYDLLNLIAIIFLLIFNFSQIKIKKDFLGNKSATLLKTFKQKGKSKILANPKFYAICETLLITVFQYAPTGFLNTKFGLLMNTGSNYFGLIFFILPFLFFIFYFLRINPLKQLDLITPAYPLALFFVKLGCFCNGCCNGIRCSWGLNNYYSNSGPYREFPVQLVEAILALLIFFFLLHCRKKAKEGHLFPIYLIVYSLTRFFSEFLRADENVFGILKTYHILCIAGVILGLAELMIITKFDKKIKKLFNSNPYTWLSDEHRNHN